MQISGHTQVFAVLGHPVEHTLSPAMHNANFQALGMDAVYTAFDVAPENLMDTLAAMSNMGFKGVNLTVPLKETAFRGLSHVDRLARHLGAVNTVEFTAGGMCGRNTDGIGFITALKESLGCGVRGKSIFILGSGGAGRAVAITCASNGAAHITLADADLARAQRLALDIRDVVPGFKPNAIPSAPEICGSAARDADIVVQATPVGMKPSDPALLPQSAFRAGQAFYDLVYMYPETATMRAARRAGARAANGLGMLLHQGAAAFTVWTGRKAAIETMRRALESAVYGGKTGAKKAKRGRNR
jgi:shikimate dehydrogenase